MISDPLLAFAGMWTVFDGDRGAESKPIPGLHNVYGFLATSPNAVVEPIERRRLLAKQPVLASTLAEVF